MSSAALSDIEDDTDSDDGHARPPSTTTTTLPDAMVERATRRNSAIRPHSMTGIITITVNEEGIPISPPPKYTTEDMEYSDPAHPRGRDEEAGLAIGPDHGHGKGDGLLMQV